MSRSLTALSVARAAVLAVATTVALVAALLSGLLGSTGSAGAAPHPSPSPSPIATNAAAAQAAARAAAARVAHLHAKLQAEVQAVGRASDAADAAEAAYAQQLTVLRRARGDERRAEQTLARAQALAASTGHQLAQLMAAQFEAGGSALDTGQLLTAQDPTQLVQLADSQAQLGQYSAGLVADAQHARDESDRALAAQQATLARVTDATARVKALRDAAATRYAEARTALLQLKQHLDKAKTDQAAADTVLSLFLGGWSVANSAEAAQLNAQYAQVAAQYAHEPLAPRSSTWTPAMAASAVHRALQRIGLPYAWAGGNLAGPTRGVCAAGAARNDCKIVGFDCSGLVLWAWGPYIQMAHYAATQYGSGRIHPRPTQLLPGDLLFWSSNGTVAGIHHVAMYVGDGNVIQAPESGDIVRITPMASVASGYFGATRPLS
ncbi:MAG: NlpC/P60 family protein [Jatrophihabitans sp.]|uniref:C40 family peptidase n=1 Tax=Jatrophihabitans sp. TaxID=1932789 RepID=UPI003F7E7333